MYNIMIAETLIIGLLSIIIFVICKEKNKNNINEDSLEDIIDTYIRNLSYDGSLHNCSRVYINSKKIKNKDSKIIEFCLFNDKGDMELHNILISNDFVCFYSQKNLLTDVLYDSCDIKHHESYEFSSFVKRRENSFCRKLSQMYIKEDVYNIQLEKKETFSNETIIQNNARKEKILKNFDAYLKDIIIISNETKDIDIIVSSSELVEILGISRDKILNINEANLDISELIFNNVESILKDLKEFNSLLKKGTLSKEEELILQKKIDEKIKIIENNL